MRDRDARKALLLRGCCALAFLLAAALAALAFAPGFELHRGHLPVEARPVADRPLWVLGLLIAVAGPGVVIWRRPHLGHALIWSLAAVGGAVLLLALAMARPAELIEAGGYDLQLVERWPAALFRLLLLGLSALLIVALPLACGVFALVAREPRPDPIAAARVHRLGRRG